MEENKSKDIRVQAKEIGDAVTKDVERRLYRESKKPYNVCIIGAGDVGKELCSGLAQRADELPNPVKKIYLLDINERKAESVLNELCAAKGKLNPAIEKAVYDSGAKNSLEDIVKNTDVFFITFDATPFRAERLAKASSGGPPPDRMESTLWNLSAVKKLAETYFKNYTGNVIVVSNLTDTLAQAFAIYSGMDSRKVIGMNQVDVNRYKFELEKWLAADKQTLGGYDDIKIDAYVAGSHNDPACIFDFYANRIKIKVPESARERINEIIKHFGPNQVKSGTTTEYSTANAAIDTLIAIMNGYQAVTASVPYEYEPGKWVYIGLPVEFEKGHAVPIEQLRKTAEQNPKFRQGVEAIKHVPSELRQLIANKDERVKDERAKQKITENEQKLYAEIDELEEKLKHFKPKILDPAVASVKKTPRIVAAGENLIAEVSEGNEQKHHSEKCIRAAKILTIKGEQYLALGLIFGGHDAVELRKVSDLSRPYKILKLKDNFTKMPGFASIVSIDDLIFASHSDAGLFRWHIDNPNNGERIYDARGLRHLNVISRANSPYLLFATEDGAKFATPDLKQTNAITIDGQNVKVTSLCSFEDCSYIGTKVGKERYAKGHVQGFKHDGKENKAERIDFVTLRKPNLIYAERIFGEKYLFVASPPGNLVGKNLDSIDAPFFLKYPEADEVEGITCVDDSIYIVSGKKMYTFNVETKEIVDEQNFEQKLMSIVKFGG